MKLTTGEHKQINLMLEQNNYKKLTLNLMTKTENYKIKSMNLMLKSIN